MLQFVVNRLFQGPSGFFQMVQLTDWLLLPRSAVSEITLSIMNGSQFLSLAIIKKSLGFPGGDNVQGCWLVGLAELASLDLAVAVDL